MQLGLLWIPATQNAKVNMRFLTGKKLPSNYHYLIAGGSSEFRLLGFGSFSRIGLGFVFIFVSYVRTAKQMGFKLQKLFVVDVLIIPDWNMILIKEEEKPHQTWFFQLWEKSEGKGLFCLKYVLNSTFQSGMGAYTEVKLFMLIQLKLMLGMTVENYMAFVSIKNAYIGEFSPK